MEEGDDMEIRLGNILLISLAFTFSCQNAQGITYNIKVHTKDVLAAGTDEYVSFRLFGIGSDGRLLVTPYKTYSHPNPMGDLFERDSLDSLTIDSYDIENIYDVEAKIERDGIYLDWWYLDYIEVYYKGNNYMADFNYRFTRNGESHTPRNMYLTCKSGYDEGYFHGRRICLDIDECQTTCTGSGEVCTNLPGSYTCTCKPGYNMVGGKCEDNNECLENGATLCPAANARCKNTPGSYRCECKVGFRGDGNTCTDINECTEVTKPCDHICHNTLGSYSCSCRTGFNLSPADNKTCLDFDECSGSSNVCDPATSVCFNKISTYMCVCKRGFKPSTLDTNKCIPKVCSPVSVHDSNIVISPSTCTSVGATVGNQCTFSCKPGYELDPIRSKFYTCGLDGFWEAPSTPKCRPLLCKRILPPKNGNVIPVSCQKEGMYQGGKCYFYCNNGHKKLGPSTVLCDKQAFSQDPTTVKCVRIPSIKCPDDVTVTLPANKPTVQLGNRFPTYNTTVQPTMVSSSPPNVGPSYEFGLGVTTITLTARNEINETATCAFNVKVQDTSAPSVKYCPRDLYFTSKGENVNVTWREPEFLDNVKVAQLRQSAMSGVLYSPTSFNVHYSAIDAQSNLASCSFRVNIKVLTCKFESFTGADQLTKANCFPMGTNAFCTAECAAGKTLDFVKDGPMKNGFLCQGASVNNIDSVFPSCVDFIPKTGATCPDGYKVTKDYRLGADGEVCGKCPRGTFFDKNVRQCKECPAGKYQDEEGKLSCKDCPAGTRSRTTRTILKAKCVALCPLGTFSPSGLIGVGNEACTPCPINTFAEQFGTTQCTACPTGTKTQSTGTDSHYGCLKPPKLWLLHPVATIYEGSTASIDCISEGLPEPNLRIVKMLPILNASEHGTHSSSSSHPRRGLSTIRYTITGVALKDADTYSCSGENSQGEASGTLKLEVKPKVPGGGGTGGSGGSGFMADDNFELGGAFDFQEKNGE